MTRLWVSGTPVEVHVTAEEIVRLFVWEGRRHVVQGVANRWRIDLGWWRLRVWRDYFKLHTTTGLLVILYHDLLTDRWYLQRIYD